MTAVMGCPLCPSPVRDRRALYQGRGWVVVPHPTPAAYTAQHLLLVPDEHHLDLLDVTPWLLASAWTVLAWVRGAYKLPAYGLAANCGDPDWSGAAFEHAHMEVIVGDQSDPGLDKVTVPMFARPPRKATS